MTDCFFLNTGLLYVSENANSRPRTRTGLPAALSRTSWQRCLQDALSSLQCSSGPDSLPVILLKCEALHGLNKHEEAVEEVSNFAFLSFSFLLT